MKPVAFSLSQNTPNPFNPTTTIEFTAPSDCRVMLKVYNASGQQVATLADGFHRAGLHAVTWDAAGMPSGLYFYTLRAGGSAVTKKMLLLK